MRAGDGRQRPCRPAAADVLRDDQRAHATRPRTGPVPPMLKRPQRNAKRDREARQHERRELHERRDQVVLGERAASTPNGLPGIRLERPVEAGADRRAPCRRRAGCAPVNDHASPPTSSARTDGQQRERRTRVSAGDRDRARSCAAPCRRSWPGRARARPSCRASRSSTIRPSYMTRMRSARSRISSSSNETSSTAQPASRCSTRRRCTNSIAPTSRPRVGCAASSRRGSDWISRASTTFCWLPPESARAGVSGPPPRTS